jgi:hypothetical protein
MDIEKEDSKFRKFNNTVEKYALFGLLLIPYLFLSFYATKDLFSSDRQACGTGYTAVGMGQVFFAVLATLILGYKMFRNEGYGKWDKIVVFSLIFIPLIIYMTLAQ